MSAVFSALLALAGSVSSESVTCGVCGVCGVRGGGIIFKISIGFWQVSFRNEAPFTWGGVILITFHESITKQ